MEKRILLRIFYKIVIYSIALFFLYIITNSYYQPDTYFWIIKSILFFIIVSFLTNNMFLKIGKIFYEDVKYIFSKKKIIIKEEEDGTYSIVRVPKYVKQLSKKSKKSEPPQVWIYKNLTKEESYNLLRKMKLEKNNLLRKMKLERINKL